MATIINTGGSGAAVKFNVFCQSTEPETKDGIWLKTSTNVTPKKIVFDTSVWAGNQWVIPSPVSNMETATASSNCVACNDKIYIFGGIMTGSICSDSAKAYDPKTDYYADLRPLPTGAWGFGCVESEGKIYIFGGYKNGAIHIYDYYMYDPLTNVYTTLGKQASPKVNAYYASLNGKIYIFGGLFGEYVRVTLSIYDIETNTFSLSTNMKNDRKSGCCEVFGEEIYLFGGENGAESLSSSIAYNIQTKEYRDLTSLPKNKVYMSCELVGDKIYIFGGAGGGTHSDALSYDPQTDRYEPLQSMRTGISHTACAKIGNRIYIFGGRTQNELQISTVECMSLIPKQYPDNPTAVIYRQPNDHTHITSLLATKLIDYLPVYFKDAMLFKDGDVTFPAVYCGDGENWNLIREEQ